MAENYASSVSNAVYALSQKSAMLLHILIFVMW